MCLQDPFSKEFVARLTALQRIPTAVSVDNAFRQLVRGTVGRQDRLLIITTILRTLAWCVSQNLDWCSEGRGTQEMLWQSEALLRAKFERPFFQLGRSRVGAELEEVWSARVPILKLRWDKHLDVDTWTADVALCDLLVSSWRQS